MGLCQVARPRMREFGIHGGMEKELCTSTSFFQDQGRKQLIYIQET
jgi:hypothetical protein